jgi:membrane-associated phospholipid phosphatase
MRERSAIPLIVVPADAGRIERRSLPRDPAAIRRALVSPWAWAPPAAALLLLTALLATGTNHAVFLALNHAGRPLGADFWLHLTLLGDGAVALALVLPWIRRAPRCFWAGIVAALVAAAWTQGVKHLVEVPRPLAVFASGAFFHAGPQYRHAAFPSGHAAAAFALAGIWTMTLRVRAWRIGLLLAAALVSLSRVMVGVHWPADLLGGMLGGWFGAWLGLALAARRGWHTRGPAALAAGMALLTLCGALLVSGHVGVPAVMPLQRVIGAVCLAAGAWDVAGIWMRWRVHAGRAAGAPPAWTRRRDG